MNKLSKLILMLPLALAPLAGQAAPKGGSHAALAAGFVAPPDSVQTSVYWYWLSGNVSKEGVVKDLEAMKRAGINRAFIGNIGLGELATPYAPVKLFTDEWWGVTHAALKRASELGIEIGMFNSPGWSQAGGPWIEPGQAMRYLASVKAHVRGGGKVEAELPRPSADFQDVRVVAYPAPAVGRAALTAADTRVTVAGTAAGAQCLIDGDPATELLFDGSPEAVIDLVTDADMDLRNITVWPARRPIRAEAELQVKGADGYRTIASFGIDRSNPNIEVGFDPYAPVSVSVAKTTGREFRLIVRGAGKDTGFAEVLLSSLPRVERYAEKTFAKMFQSPLPYWEEYQWRDQPALDDASLAVDPAKVVDLDYALKHMDGIAKVNNRLDLASQLESFRSGVLMIFVWFLAVLIIVTVFIIVNTIKLSVYSRRHEITVMRYVGATGMFIAAPFILEGIIIGIFSAILSYFLEWYAYYYVEQKISSDLQMISFVGFSEVSGYVLGGFIALGILTGIVGSLLSLRKYLKA